MMRRAYFLSFLLVFVLACSMVSAPVASRATPEQEIVTDVVAVPSQIEESPTEESSALVDVYDPARNPAEDVQQAISIAQRENKRIMLEVGGNWCIWCKYMDDFYATHNDILQFRAENYVLVKVSFGDGNTNEEFLSQFPEVGGYPHIYILDRDGTLLHSQDTVELEDGAASYVPEVFMAFLQEWAPPK
ncbi:MAG TPA: thioredoxin family protein [Anaerolineales bacterium]|nr:thioredoxin family protein [Anaerolineales bacterium]